MLNRSLLRKEVSPCDKIHVLILYSNLHFAHTLCIALRYLRYQVSWYSPSRPHFFAGMNFKHNFKGGIGVYIKNFMCHCCIGFVQGMVPLKNSLIS